MSLLRPLSSFAAAALVAVSLFSVPAQADDVADGQAIVKDLMSSAIRDFGGKKVPVDERNAIVHGYIDKFASPRLSAQDILGRYWNRATPEEQTLFQTLAVDYAIGSWGKQLNSIRPSRPSLSPAPRPPLRAVWCCIR